MLEVCSAQTCVDVLATQTARQSGGQVQLFSRAVRASQCTDGLWAVLGFDALQAVGHVFKGGLPIDFFPLATLLEHWQSQAVRAF